MFANRIFHQKQLNRPDTPKMTNGLIQHIKVEESTSIQRVRVLFVTVCRQMRQRNLWNFCLVFGAFFGKEKPHLFHLVILLCIVLEEFSEYWQRYTVQVLCIGTDRSQQTVQTKIRLLLKKQSDQGLCCLPFHQHLLDALMQSYIKLFYF